MSKEIDGKLLLVGGAGYVGSVLTEHLLTQGCSIRCLDLLLYGNHASVLPYLGNERYELMVGDLTDPTTLERALEGVRSVVLLAGLVGDPITRKHPEASHAINDVGLSRCVDALRGRGLDKVVFISTCSNYGLMADGVLADEGSELKPLSLYAQSKVDLEKKIMSLRGTVDYCPTILRFATAFGLSPRMRFDLTVSEFTRSLFLDQDLEVYDADTWRPYCHVRDFSRVIGMVLKAPAVKVAFETFNVGGDENNCTKKMIVDEILKQLPGRRVTFKAHGQDKRNYKVSFGKIQRAFEFQPRYKVSDGVSELIEALRQGFFCDCDLNKNFYGNYSVNYPAPKPVDLPHAI